MSGNQPDSSASSKGEPLRARETGVEFERNGKRTNERGPPNDQPEQGKDRHKDNNTKTHRKTVTKRQQNEDSKTKTTCL